ncbi:serine kinase [candidate division TA06 bacterium]|uniref:Serine kinase n=1 Tax=candidate division TA06 bacterium TaxID=2250710 RepID=A0A523XH33_UNCT6|nr:MAG: serine kinase [candidate division TA06 bacterium]
MKLNEIIDKLNLEVLCGSSKLDNEVRGGYASDLLSDVIANSREGNIWVTLQIHLNIVAVASLNRVSGILLVNGRHPEEETIRKAETEGIPILVSKLPAFEIIGRLHDLGVHGVGDGGSV